MQDNFVRAYLIITHNMLKGEQVNLCAPRSTFNNHVFINVEWCVLSLLVCMTQVVFLVLYWI